MTHSNETQEIQNWWLLKYLSQVNSTPLPVFRQCQPQPNFLAQVPTCVTLKSRKHRSPFLSSSCSSWSSFWGELIPQTSPSDNPITFCHSWLVNSPAVKRLLRLSQASPLFPSLAPSSYILLILSSPNSPTTAPTPSLPSLLQLNPWGWSLMTLLASFPEPLRFPSNPILLLFSFHCFLLPTKAPVLYYPFFPSHMHKDRRQAGFHIHIIIEQSRLEGALKVI